MLRIRITKDEEVVVRGGLEEEAMGIWARLTLSGSAIFRSQPLNFVLANYVCLGIQFMKVPALPVGIWYPVRFLIMRAIHP